MRVFVTGGTGFLGKQIVRLLVQQGHEVRALSESRVADQTLRVLGATPVPGDVTDRTALAAGMAGCNTVIHAANPHFASSGDGQAATMIVTGTRNTLEAAHDLDIPRIVFVDSVAIFGDTQGQLVNETYTPPGPPEGQIARALWDAYYEVALPLVEQGAAIITVLPGAMYGPGDTSWLDGLMRRFYRGTLPVVPAPETTLTYAYGEDVALGCILAAEKGRPGELYCLTGPAVPLGELVEFWAQITGHRPPPISLSARTLQTVTPVIDAGTQSELVAYLGGTYTARSDKARRELGWTTRPMQTTTKETFEWIAATEPADVWERRRHTGFLVAAGIAGLLLLWLWLRRDGQANES